MNNYLLYNYKFSKCKMLQSVFVSEYGLRHWAHSKKQTPYKWGDRIIPVIELCALIGLIATIIEKLVVSCIDHNKLEPSPPTKIEKLVVSSIGHNKLEPSPPTKIEKLVVSSIGHNKLEPSPPTKPSYVTSLTKKEQWLFRGTQTGCNGPVSVTKVESIRAKLDAHRPIGIQFNQKKIAPSIEGGTCTAMSLEFLDSYFKTKKISIKQPDAQSDMLMDHLIKLGHNFASSCQEMRDRQAAYNTIEVQLRGDDIDYSKNKMQSLANYHSLIIDYSSPEIDIDKLDDENALSKEIDALPEGAFIVRILKPRNNEKLEEYGHSLVYIKERGLGLFYDPNYGVINLSPSEHSKILFEGFKSCFQSFEINKARFYRFQDCPKQYFA